MQADIIHMDLECPVCMEPFTSANRVAKGLRCHHSMCLPCATQLIKNSQIQCPTCRNVEPIINASQLFTHHMMMQLVQERERKTNQPDQKAIKDDLEEAFDRISQYKLAFHKKIALVEENNTKLRKSTAQAKRQIKEMFESCMKLLQERMNQLLEEIGTTEKSLKGQASEAQADFDKAARLQHEHENLMEKEKVTAEEYDSFKKNEALLQHVANALSEKQDQQSQEIKVDFDHTPNIKDVIKRFGQLQVPKAHPTKHRPDVPAHFTQLVPDRTIGTEGSRHSQFLRPWGVAVTPTGTLLVTDRGNNRVQELDAEGRVIRVIGASGSTEGCFNAPTDVAVSSADKLYVADNNNHRIQIFDHKGNYLNKFGRKGSKQGEFVYPTGLALDSALKLLYVSDLNNRRIQVFDLDGN